MPTKIHGNEDLKILAILCGIEFEDIRNTHEIQGVIRWARIRSRAWGDHVKRMDDDRLAKIAKDGKPNDPRPPGRSPKHWCES
jgi:hypothetical protein